MQYNVAAKKRPRPVAQNRVAKKAASPKTVTTNREPRKNAIGSRVVIKRGKHTGKFATVEGKTRSYSGYYNSTSAKLKLRLDNGKMILLIPASVGPAPKITDELVDSVIADVRALHALAAEGAKLQEMPVVKREKASKKIEWEYEGHFAYHKDASQCPSGRPRCPGHHTE